MSPTKLNGPTRTDAAPVARPHSARMTTLLVPIGTPSACEVECPSGRSVNHLMSVMDATSNKIANPARKTDVPGVAEAAVPPIHARICQDRWSPAAIRIANTDELSELTAIPASNSFSEGKVF